MADMPSVSTGDLVVLAPVGDLEASSVLRLRAELDHVIEQGRHQVVVNLGDVSYLGEEAMGVLVGAWRRLRARQGRLRLVCPAGHTLDRLRTTGLTRVVSVYPDVAAALAEPRRAG